MFLLNYRYQVFYYSSVRLTKAKVCAIGHRNIGMKIPLQDRTQGKWPTPPTSHSFYTSSPSLPFPSAALSLSLWGKILL